MTASEPEVTVAERRARVSTTAISPTCSPAARREASVTMSAAETVVESDHTPPERNLTEHQITVCHP
jgi:hypothetical protein